MATPIFTSRYRVEFKKQTRMALCAAIGFIIAFAWNDYILILTSKLFSYVSELFPTMCSLLSASVLTFLGVALIFITSRILE